MPGLLSTSLPLAPAHAARLLLRALGDLPGHPFYGNQWTTGVGGTAPKEKGEPRPGSKRYFGTTRQGPPAVSLKKAKALGYTDGPYYHSSNYVDEIEREGFLSKGAEKWELDDQGTMEDFHKWGTASPTMFAKNKADVVESESQGAYGNDVITVYAKPGAVKDAGGMTLLGGSYVIDPRDIIPIKGTREQARKVREERKALGGPGSGNFGHAGRPGEVGGSGPGGSSDAPTISRKTGLPFSTEKQGEIDKQFAADKTSAPSDAFRKEVGITAQEMRAKPLPTSMVEAEDRIRNQPREHGYVFTADGRVHYAGNDHPHQINLSPLDNGEPHGTPGDPLYNANFTHNHPSNGALSPDDGFVAASHNFTSISAVVDNGTWTLTRAGSQWPNPTVMHAELLEKSEEVRREFSQYIKDNAMTIADANRDHWAKVWTEYARHDTRVKFTFEPKK